MRGALCLLLLACACSRTEPPVTASTKTRLDNVRSLDLKPAGEGTITFDTGRFRGILKIEPGLATQYESVSQTHNGVHVATAKITIKGQELVIEEDRIRLGEHKIGPLSGEIRVEVRSDGVYVDGTKKSDL